MAVLTRRTWAELLTETILRVGNITASGFDTRLKYFLAASYTHLCTRYHHVELDTRSTVECSTSANFVALPSDLYILVAVILHQASPDIYIFPPGPPIIGPLVIEDYRLTSDNYVGYPTLARPTKCARYGNNLYFDSLPDQAYVVEFAYYRRGLLPNFGTTSPELDYDVDEHIMDGALRLAFPAVARADLGEVNRQLLEEWAESQVRVPLLDPLTNLPERERTGTTYTKGQG
jgi:hypothetical protein